MNGCIIPNTPIAVDYWKILQASQVRFFFLTHMHGDHIVGLTPSWSQNIYCSPVTKKLLLNKFKGINENLIHELEIDAGHLIALNDRQDEWMTVTAIDANHCPGAVMFLFEGYFGNILYTGDFRYSHQLHLHHNSLCNKSIDLLYIDNTYCDPKYEFPSREKAKQEIVDIIKQFPQHKVIIGMRNLGKEDLLVELAQYFRTWVIVEPNRNEQLKILDLPNVFSTKNEGGFISTVNIYEINDEKMKLYNSSQPTIAIIPTALYLTGERKLCQNQSIFVVPYSDHSSFQELVDFVSFLKPKKVFPIVHYKGKNQKASNMSYFDKFLDKTPLKQYVVPTSIEIVNLFNQSCSNTSTIRTVASANKSAKPLYHSSSMPVKKGVSYDSPPTTRSQGSVLEQNKIYANTAVKSLFSPAIDDINSSKMKFGKNYGRKKAKIDLTNPDFILKKNSLRKKSMSKTPPFKLNISNASKNYLHHTKSAFMSNKQYSMNEKLETSQSVVTASTKIKKPMQLKNSERVKNKKTQSRAEKLREKSYGQSDDSFDGVNIQELKEEIEKMEMESAQNGNSKSLTDFVMSTQSDCEVPDSQPHHEQETEVNNGKNEKSLREFVVESQGCTEIETQSNKDQNLTSNSKSSQKLVKLELKKLNLLGSDTDQVKGSNYKSVLDSRNVNKGGKSLQLKASGKSCKRYINVQKNYCRQTKDSGQRIEAKSTSKYFMQDTQLFSDVNNASDLSQNKQVHLRLDVSGERFSIKGKSLQTTKSKHKLNDQPSEINDTLPVKKLKLSRSNTIDISSQEQKSEASKANPIKRNAQNIITNVYVRKDAVLPDDYNDINSQNDSMKGIQTNFRTQQVKILKGEEVEAARRKQKVFSKVKLHANCEEKIDKQKKASNVSSNIIFPQNDKSRDEISVRKYDKTVSTTAVPSLIGVSRHEKTSSYILKCTDCNHSFDSCKCDLSCKISEISRELESPHRDVTQSAHAEPISPTFRKVVVKKINRHIFPGIQAFTNQVIRGRKYNEENKIISPHFESANYKEQIGFEYILLEEICRSQRVDKERESTMKFLNVPNISLLYNVIPVSKKVNTFSKYSVKKRKILTERAKP